MFGHASSLSVGTHSVTALGGVAVGSKVKQWLHCRVFWSQMMKRGRGREGMDTRGPPHQTSLRQNQHPVHTHCLQPSGRPPTVPLKARCVARNGPGQGLLIGCCERNTPCVLQTPSEHRLPGRPPPPLLSWTSTQPCPPRLFLTILPVTEWHRAAKYQTWGRLVAHHLLPAVH